MGYEYSQVLSNSIGNATVASGYITPGLTSNPANLAAIQFGYFQLNFSNSQYNSIPQVLQILVLMGLTLFIQLKYLEED